MTLLLAIVVILISAFDKKGNLVHYIGRFWALFNIYLSGTRLSIKGTEKIKKGQTYIVMSNHQSLFDVLALIGKLPIQIRWIIKSDIRKIPIFGYALERMGHIYVDRRGRKDTVYGLEKAVMKIKTGTSVVIFPEGTRSPDGRLLPFRTGGAAIAFKSGVPILPVTVNGGRFVLPKGTLALMPGKIRIIVGDEIDSMAFQEGKREALMAGIKAAIEKDLDLTYGALTKMIWSQKECPGP
jgi:1-acyl-sn-glycerol-3-phosphate acyltransferase